MGRQTREVGGGAVGAMTGAVIGLPGTTVLVFNLYWDKPGSPIGMTAFAAFAWGGFIACGAVTGWLLARFSGPKGGDRP